MGSIISYESIKWAQLYRLNTLDSIDYCREIYEKFILLVIFIFSLRYQEGIEPPQTGHEPIMLPLHHRYHLVWQMVVHLVVADGGLYGELDVVLDCGE